MYEAPITDLANNRLRKLLKGQTFDFDSDFEDMKDFACAIKDIGIVRLTEPDIVLVNIFFYKQRKGEDKSEEVDTSRCMLGSFPMKVELYNRLNNEEFIPLEISQSFDGSYKRSINEKHYGEYYLETL